VPQRSKLVGFYNTVPHQNCFSKQLTPKKQQHQKVLHNAIFELERKTTLSEPKWSSLTGSINNDVQDTS
jgi:hypothetical protein